MLVLFRVISWMVFLGTKRTIHEITRNNANKSTRTISMVFDSQISQTIRELSKNGQSAIGNLESLTPAYWLGR
jgi:hypothetical protein